MNPGFEKSGKAAALSVFFFGYATHLYAFTNLIPNMDGLSRLYETQTRGLLSGRWFLAVASLFHGFTEAPALIGFLSLLFLAVAAALITDLLGLKSVISGVVAGAFIVISMALTYTFAFIFTASAYCFAILLSVLSVWIAARAKRAGWIYGALVLAFSVGIYQSYVALAASLALVLLIIRGASFKEALRYLYLLAAALVVYYAVLKASLLASGSSLLSYRGVDGSGLNISSLIGNAGAAYVDFFRYLFIPGSFPYVGNVGAVCGIACLAFCLYRLLPVFKGNPLTILYALLLPLSVNCLQLTGENSPHMRYAFVCFYLLFIALAEKFLEEKGEKPVPVICFIAVCALSLLSTAALSNRVYTMLDTAHRATLSFSTTLVTRVQSFPGYNADSEVVLIGTPSSDEYKTGVEQFNALSSYLAPADTLFYGYKHLYYYVNDWLNVTWDEPSPARFEELAETESFRSMPLYPDDGSIAVIDGAVVVRLSEEYTPKQQYEIDYEEAFSR